jgi:hypothetical protein
LRPAYGVTIKLSQALGYAVIPMESVEFAHFSAFSWCYYEVKRSPKPASTAKTPALFNSWGFIEIF